MSHLTLTTSVALMSQLLLSGCQSGKKPITKITAGITQADEKVKREANELKPLSLSEGNIITDYLVNIVAILIILGGFIWLLIDAYQDAKITIRKKVVVVEGRGLRKVATMPLHKVVAKHFSGKIDALTIDITQRLRDGEVIYPPDTFNNNIKTIVSNIATRIDGIDHQDLTLVYGGFLPVPFTFYLSAILDDNGPVSVFDWDRVQEQWRLIDNNADDDHADLRILEESQEHTPTPEDVVLAFVYQYEKNHDIAYPWAVEIPGHGKPEGAVFMTPALSQAPASQIP